MTLRDTTTPDQTHSLAFEFDLPHPPEKVWRALTTPELLAEWLLPVIGWQDKPGTRFTFKTQPYPGWDGTVDCQLLDIEPYHLLRYAWTVPMLDTVVTFTLTPTDTGTHVLLVQSGFREDQKQNWGGARYGWKMMGGKLVDLLGTMS